VLDTFDLFVKPDPRWSPSESCRQWRNRRHAWHGARASTGVEGDVALKEYIAPSRRRCRIRWARCPAREGVVVVHKGLSSQGSRHVRHFDAHRAARRLVAIEGPRLCRSASTGVEGGVRAEGIRRAVSVSGAQSVGGGVPAREGVISTREGVTGQRRGCVRQPASSWSHYRDWRQKLPCDVRRPLGVEGDVSTEGIRCSVNVGGANPLAAVSNPRRCNRYV